MSRGSATRGSAAGQPTGALVNSTLAQARAALAPAWTPYVATFKAGVTSGAAGTACNFGTSPTASGQNATVNGTDTNGKYLQIGSLVVFEAFGRIGPSATVGTGTISVEAPTDISGGLTMNMWWRILDFSATDWFDGRAMHHALFVPDASRAVIFSPHNSAEALTGNVAHNLPITLGDSDEILVGGVYEAA